MDFLNQNINYFMIFAQIFAKLSLCKMLLVNIDTSFLPRSAFYDVSEFRIPHLVPPKVGHFFQLTKFPPYIFHFSEALTGDYKGVDHSGAWEKMINYCEKENRAGCIDAEHISVYLDDPMTTPAEKGGHFDRLSDRRGEFKVRCPAGITAGQRRRCRARAYSYIH